MMLSGASKWGRFLLFLTVGLAATAIVWQMAAIVGANREAARVRRIMDVNIELLDAACRFAACLADERARSLDGAEAARSMDGLSASRSAVNAAMLALAPAVAGSAIPATAKERLIEELRTLTGARELVDARSGASSPPDNPESRIIQVVIDAIHEVPNAPTTAGLGKIMASVFELARAYEAAALMRDSLIVGKGREIGGFSEDDSASIGYHSLFFLIHFPPANLSASSKKILRSIGSSPEWALVCRRFQRKGDSPGGVGEAASSGERAEPLGRILDAIRRAEVMEVNGLRDRIVDLRAKGRAELGLHVTAFAALLIALGVLVGLTVTTIRGSSRLAASNGELKAKNEQILASVNYARVIQLSMLPRDEAIGARLADWFIFYKPRDIVGGDYYWFKDLGEDGFLVAVVDCTGHGVPGAFMAMTSNSVLNSVAEHVASCHSPAEILGMVNRVLMDTLHQADGPTLSNDGLDMGLCWVRERERRMLFSGARFSLYSARDGQVREALGDRRSIGYKRSNLEEPFTEHAIELVEGRVFYMCSDGFLDQAGGEKGFGFGRKRFKAMLAEGCSLPLDEQKESYVRTLEEYMGRLRQTDDITLIGFRVL